MGRTKGARNKGFYLSKDLRQYLLDLAFGDLSGQMPEGSRASLLVKRALDKAEYIEDVDRVILAGLILANDVDKVRDFVEHDIMWPVGTIAVVEGKIDDTH